MQLLTARLGMEQLNAHLDDLAARARAKKEAEQTYRGWYSSSAQWITDFGRLRNEDETEAHWQREEPNELEELTVKADEYFPRCPISGCVSCNTYQQQKKEKTKNALYNLSLVMELIACVLQGGISHHHG